MEALKTTFTVEELKVSNNINTLHHIIKIQLIWFYLVLHMQQNISFQAIFEKMDWDKNGEISKIEFKSYLAKYVIYQ